MLLRLLSLANEEDEYVYSISIDLTEPIPMDEAIWLRRCGWRAAGKEMSEGLGQKILNKSVKL
jgi:hypothetical protein